MSAEINKVLDNFLLLTSKKGRAPTPKKERTLSIVRQFSIRVEFQGIEIHATSPEVGVSGRTFFF
jgi:hypothetical protein